MAYDARGIYVVETQNPEGHVERFETSSADGLQRSYTDPNGYTKTCKYDGFGRPVEERRNDLGVTTTFTYAPSRYNWTDVLPENAVATTTASTRADGSPDVLVVSSSSDTSGRTVATTRQGFAAGTSVRESVVFDQYGRPVTQSRPHLLNDRTQGSISVSYDTLGRPVDTATADGRHQYTFYASSKSLRSDLAGLYLTDPSARWIVVGRTPSGDSAQVVNDRGLTILSSEGPAQKTKFEYGASGFLLSVVDPVGNRTAQAPDAFGRVAITADPDSGSHRYTYDAWDQVLTHIHNTETHTLTHDGLGRTTSLRNSDGLTQWIWDRFSTDPAGTYGTRVGSLIQQRAPDGTVDAYSYLAPGGALDSVSRHVQTATGPVDLKSTYEYDPFGRPSVVHYPGSAAFAIRYRYNARGFLEQVENANDPAERFWKLDQAYEGHRPQTVRLGDSSTEETVYDPRAGWINERTTTQPGLTQPLLREVIGHDASGNVASVRRIHDPSETVATYYAYDSLERLKTVTRGSGASAAPLAGFTYTATGNIKTKTGMGTYTYGLAGQPDTGPQTAPHAVRRTSDAGGSHDYDYDTNGFGRMVRRTGPSVPGGRQTFAYTASGKVRRIETGTPIAVTTFAYGAGGDRVQRTQPDGTSTVYFGGLYEREVSPDNGTTETLRIVVGEQAIAEVTRVSGVRRGIAYLHRDRMGSPEVLTNGIGAVVSRQGFGSFGEPSGTSNSQSTALGYTGHHGERDLGLVDMVGRFYDPQLGRFLTPDPTVPNPLFSQAYNRYSYVNNNPINFTDPSGYNGEPTEKNTGSSCPLVICGPIAVALVAIWVGVGALSGEWSLGGQYRWWQSRNWSNGNPANWDWSKASFTQWGGEHKVANWDIWKASFWKGDSSAIHPEPAADLRAAAVMAGSAGGTPLSASSANPTGTSLDPHSQAFSELGSRYGGCAACHVPRTFEWTNGYDPTVADIDWEWLDLQAQYGRGLAMVAGPSMLGWAAGLPAAAGGGGTIDTASVRFTQSSVKGTFSDGRTIQSTVDALRGPGGDAVAKSIPPIRIFEDGGVLKTLDNRRLLTFSEAGRPVPFRWASPAEVAADSWKFTATPQQQNGWFIRVKP